MAYDPSDSGPPMLPPRVPFRPVPPLPARGRVPLVPLLLLAILSVLLWRAFFDRGAPAVDPRPVTPAGSLAADETATTELFQEVSPSVVYITTAARQVNLFNRAVQEVPQGTGSGFVWDDAGHVVTNFHVIQNANSAFVTLNDHTSYPASLVGYAPDHDLAVLRIDVPKSKLRPISRIGTSHDLKVGQKVFAVGNPFGLDQTLTTGVVSALGRTIRAVTGRDIEDVIQIDAAINPGNSGGPLFDSSRRLIGVNTAIYSPTGASAGIGFAVPVDTVNRVVPQLISRKKLPSIDTGIRIDDRISESIERFYGVRGAAVLAVRPDSPAARAGLRGATRAADGSIIPGDVILKVNDRPVRTSQDFFAALQRHNPGDTVTLAVRRGAETIQVPLELQAAEE